MALITEDGLGITDPKKTNLAKTPPPVDGPIPTAEENASKLADVKDRGEELMRQHVGDYLEQQQEEQYGDPAKATESGVDAVANKEFRGVGNWGRDQTIEGERPAVDSDYLYQSWFGEVQKGFLRGVGQSVSSTGDIINFLGSTFPTFSMLEGNLFGNGLNRWGANIEDANRTYVRDQLEKQNFTWASFLDPNVWSSELSELIPTALEFMFTGYGAGAVAENSAGWFARKLPGIVGRVGGEAAEVALRKTARQTVTGMAEALGGEAATIDVIGSGGKIGRHLLRDVAGKMELAEFSKNAVNFAGAGLANNMMSGVMNGMQTMKQMKETNKALIAQGQEPAFTDDEMAKVVTGTIANNANYLPIDILSWAITYGKAFEKLGRGFAKPVIKDAEETMKQAKGFFGRSVMPVGKAMFKVAGHAIPEGVEESFQETFENWAAAKAKAKVTGEDVPDYWDYYMSDENRKTIGLSAMMGGLMGGGTNLKSVFNNNANNAFNYMDSTETLRASIAAENTKGQMFKEYHIQNMMLNLHTQDKADLFDKFMTGLVAEGTITEEQVKPYKAMFDAIGNDFSIAQGLNIKGKEALMRSTVAKQFLQQSIERDKVEMNEQIANVTSTFAEGEQRDAAIQKIKDSFKEAIETKDVLIAHHEANRLNLISGKKAKPVNMSFVVSKDGKEHLLAIPEMQKADFDMAQNKAAIVGGLSEEQWNEYVNKSDDQIFEEAKENNRNLKKSMGQRVRDIYNQQKTVLEDQTQDEQGDDAANDETAQETDIPEVVEQTLAPEEQARKAEIEKTLADDDAAALYNDENAGVEQETKPVLEPVKRQQLETELEGINKKEADLKSKFEADTAAREKLVAEKQAEQTTADETKKNVSKELAGGERVREMENEFEQENIDAESIDDGKKTLAQQEKEEEEKAVKEFLDSENTDNTDDTDEEPDDEKSDSYDDYEVVDDNGAVRIKDPNGNFVSGKDGKPRAFASPALAKYHLKTMAKNGKASIMSRVKSIFKKSPKVQKAAPGSPEESLEDKNKREEAIFKKHEAVDDMRRNIIRSVEIARGNLATAANPTVHVQQNELDAYLNSTITKFQHGPNITQQMIVVNRMLKAKGINIDVIAADNLMRAVGLPAVGYTVASTIFIDSEAWNDNKVFHHEMSHVLFRVTKDAPETKQVIAHGRENKELVDFVMRSYGHHVVYNIEDIDGQMVQSTLLEFATNNMNISYDEALATKPEVLLEMMGNPKMAPDEVQDTINEELFCFTMQGPLSKKYDKLFNKIKEPARKKVYTSWLNWINDKEEKSKEDAYDVVAALNNGVDVPTNHLFDFVIKGFVDNISNKAITSDGYASMIARQTAKEKREAQAIGKDKEKQQRAYDAQEVRERMRKNIFDRTMESIKKEIKAQEGLTNDEKEKMIERVSDELEEGMLESGAFDDFEMAKSFVFRGATRILNNFTKSMNYVKRQRFLKNPNNVASDFNSDELIDRDALNSALYNLAYETKGDTNRFIQLIENSPIHEISMFSKYMDKLYPGEKRMLLSSMGFVMGNSVTISAMKSVVNAQGEYSMVNALSETETNRVQSHLNKFKNQISSYFNAKNNGLPLPQSYVDFLKSYGEIKKGTATNQDYLNVLRTLTPAGTKFSELIRSNSINVRGTTGSVKYVLDNVVKKGMLEKRTNDKGEQVKINPETYNIYYSQAEPLIAAIVDSNRKFTSYSVVQNAEGNMEPSKITNNHLTTEVRNMIEFLAKKPSFAAFKREYSHILPSNVKSKENPILRNIYDQFKKGNTVPSITQYMGLKHQQSGKNMLYKDSTDFTQSVEDFLMFASRGSSAEYQQSLGAFADSPRKFYFSAPRLKHADVFTKGVSGNKLSEAGKNMLKNSFEIYQSLNKNAKNPVIGTYQEFEKQFMNELAAEKAQWNEFGNDLENNKTLAPYFDKGKLNAIGNQKIEEFVFNQAVNGMALSEIFNPGVAVEDITKRNKGNSSPVVSTGNKNLKIEPVFINDKVKNPDGTEKYKTATDSGMYMLRSQAEKIVAAGLGVFDLNNGLKLLNYSIDRDNPNFAGRAAYFKGYTTIIDADTLITEPGLKGVYDLLMERAERYDVQHFSKYGEYPSDDLLNGKANYLNVAIPLSAVKSDLLTSEQEEMLKDVTYDSINEAGEDFSKFHAIQDKLFNDAKGNFMGLSGYNFGPQQIMDKYSDESTTPVQFIASLVVNGSTQGTLAQAEEIQKLIRKDMTDNLDDILRQLNNMNPTDYKKFILQNMDLENMDQAQRLFIEEKLTNLNHTAIEDFVTNTLANRLKNAANKLKTSGSIAQQKPSYHYRHRNGYSVGSSTTLRGFRNNDRMNADGSKGSNVLEIVLPKHMQAAGIKSRTYLAMGDNAAMELVAKNKNWSKRYQNGNTEEKLNVLREVALKEALHRFGTTENPRSFGYNLEDYIGTFKKDGKTIGYYVRGENVMASRIPSHGPASTGVFEVVDFLAGEGNQTIVSHEFSDVIGSDYDGDALFIQRKDKHTPNFNKALDKTVELWTSPEMFDQIRAKINFEDKVKEVLKNNNIPVDDSFPMSPRFHRNAYNNTMISKRNIGNVFNMHRIANYLAAYNVGLNSPIAIDGKRADRFSDDKAGQDSRNNLSAMLANIILDNAKYHYADKLGLNDQTIKQFVLLTNMGFGLKEVSAIMNSDAVKSWNRHQKNNSSPYLKELSPAEITNRIFSDLQIDQKMSASYSIDTKNLGSDQQKRNVIALMEHLEKMNSDIQKISKIMAGHKGIENDPFVLEKQLSEMESVFNPTDEKPILNFPEGFKNNPDIKAYFENGKKILEVLKKANRIYRKSTGELVSKLNTKFGRNGMTETQLRRVSDVLKKFTNSRILGLNNIPVPEKLAKRQAFFNELSDYMQTLFDTDIDGRTAYERSTLFSRALNVYFGDKDHNGSYASANPRFFNESIGRDEKLTIQREFEELPQSLKDGMILVDMMDNGLQGPLSLVNIFDQHINADISSRALSDQQTKDEPISKKVMGELENLIVTQEFDAKDSQIPYINTRNQYEESKIVQFIQRENPMLYRKMKNGEATYFKINNRAYEFDGFPKSEIKRIQVMMKGHYDQQAIKFDQLIKDNIHPYQKFEAATIPLKAISIADNNWDPYKAPKSYNNDSKADHIVSANIVQEEKKKHNGKAALMDYHRYNSTDKLSREEFDTVMEYKNVVNEEQKDAIYRIYEREKEEANLVAKTVNQVSVSSMSTEHLKGLYEKYAEKDMYAYSIVTTPILLEIANRSAREQSSITKGFENNQDMGFISTWFDNNNIPSNHPATQAIVRQLGAEYKTFVQERSKYVKEINAATEALYTEKFKLSQNSIVRTLQRAYKSLFENRQNLYDQLYGNLIEQNIIKLPDGKERKEFKLRDRETIEKMYADGYITDVEKNFYDVFTKTTKALEEFGSGGKKRRDYIPHTAMSDLEMFSSRGLLGLMVNSKPQDDAINDVKVIVDVNGVDTLMPFREVRNQFNALAASGDKSIARIVEFNRYKSKAKKFLKKGENEDGSAIEYSNVQNATMLGMGPMSRFSGSRSVSAEEMPSMDLNKALVDYVHTTLFTNGNGVFKGFKKLMPLIDGVMAYNDRKGYKNAYKYTKEVIKEKFIMRRDQELFGPTADKVINGMVKANLLYALGYQGLVVGKAAYAIGNTAIGKYMNIKREGGKTWLLGEKRYWGTDHGFGIDTLGRRRRAKNILKNLGFMEIDVYDDVAIEKKAGLDGVFTHLALLPMAKTEEWIQHAHFLGLLTDEEFDMFDDEGNFKDGAYMPQKRLLELEERIKKTHGKGYTPTDQSRIQTYSLGRMFMQFSRHIPAQIRERFAKEDVDVNGKKYIGSLRQIGITANEIMSNRMSPEKFKEYYESLDLHEKEALLAGLRGMAMVTLLGFISSNTDAGGPLSPNSVSSGAVSDANIHFNPDRMLFKTVPPAVRSTMSVVNGIWNGSNEKAAN